MKRENQEKLLAIFLSLVLVAVIVPMIMVAYYNFRSLDDYSFANMSERIWLETHSVIRTLWEQVLKSIELWDTWQGIYFGDWIMLSANAFWSRDAYYMSVYITLVAMIIGELTAGFVIFVKGLGSTVWQMLLACLPCILLQILLTPSPGEGYYWMCGAVAYTTTYAVSMVVLAVLISFIRQEGDCSYRKTIIMEAVVFALTFMMGGTNYVNAMFMLLVYVFMAIWCFYRRKKHRILMAVNTLWFLACFALNVFSPGTVARQSSQGESMPAVQAILRSFQEAAVYMKTWTFLPVLLVMLFMIPVFWRIVSSRGRKPDTASGPQSSNVWQGYSYKFPLLVTMISFCIFAAHFTPCLYAMWGIGPHRVQNIYRFQMFILLFGNELYWIGWIRYKWTLKKEQINSDTDNLKKDGSQKKRLMEFPFQRLNLSPPRQTGGIKISLLLPAGILATGIVFFLLYQYYLGDRMPPICAALSIRSGEAQAYYDQNQERLKILEDDTIKEVYLDPLEIRPYLLYFGDISKNPHSWENEALAKYFGKDKIVLNQPE